MIRITFFKQKIVRTKGKRSADYIKKNRIENKTKIDIREMRNFRNNIY